MTVNNNKLNDLSFNELEMIFRIQLNTMADLCDKFFNVVLFDEEVNYF